MTPSLIPEIVIGKKYRWRARLIEMVCPKCGYNAGMKYDGSYAEMIVEIVSTQDEFIKKYGVHPNCHHCGELVFLNWEGWYAVKYPGTMLGNVGVVPYTQLEEIAESGQEAEG